MSTTTARAPAMPPDDTPARRWYAFDPARTLLLAAVLMVTIVVVAVADLRRRIAELPEIGRATPKSVLDAAERETIAEIGPTHDRPQVPREDPETFHEKNR